MTSTPLTTATFCLLVGVVALCVLGALRKAGWTWGALAALVLLYLLAPALLALSGRLDGYTPMPAPGLLLLLSLTLLTVGTTLSGPGRRTAAAVPGATLVLFQAFRLVVEGLLHRLYKEGAVPVQMTYLGRNWDILSGVSGLLLGLWLLRGRPAPRWLLLSWNVLGLGLLTNIVVIAVLSTPVPFRHFLEGPPNLLPSTFPFIWLPSFLVQVALASHLLIFQQLRRETAG